MPAYEINGKEYSEFDINKRCAELLGHKVCVSEVCGQGSSKHTYASVKDLELGSYTLPNYCNSPQDTNAIIDRVLDELLEPIFCTDKNGCEWYQSRWDLIMSRYGCLKLKAACIWFIEVNEALKEQEQTNGMNAVWKLAREQGK